MLLYLLRHGIAIPGDRPGGPPDGDRPLTADGALRTRKAARGLRRLGVAPGRVLSSPFRRAVETARIAMQVLGTPRARCRTTVTLLPDRPADAVLALVRRSNARNVLCVGHAPNLDLVLAAAIGSEAPVTALRKAGAAAIEIVRGRGRLVWLLEPKALRRLGA